MFKRPQADSRDAVHSAQGVNSRAGLQRFDDASIGVGREGILVDSGYQDPATYAGATGCNNKPILSRCDVSAIDPMGSSSLDTRA